MHQTCAQECDGHSGNAKYVAYNNEQARLERPFVMYGQLLCANHQNCLSEVHMLGIANDEYVSIVDGTAPRKGTLLLSDMYATTLFLRAAGNFVRLIAVVGKIVGSKLVIIDCKPPVGSDLAIEQVRDMLLAAYSEREPTQDAMARYAELVGRYFKVFNGRPGLNSFAHYTPSRMSSRARSALAEDGSWDRIPPPGTPPCL